ncbi:MAG: chloride channel protein [Bacteroidales bacterium]|nr:chloride channel protein [Bacteroidales bacterium]
MRKHRVKTYIRTWRKEHFTERQWLLFFSFIIGILSGIAAVILKNTVHFTHSFVTSRFDVSKVNIFYFAIPITGIILTVLFVKYVVKDEIDHGISKILYSISRGGGVLRAHNTYSSLIASTLTVGFGGSVGLEAPIVLTGSAIGSNIGRFFRMSHRNLVLLIGCGAAGAVAGIFNAPIAGVLFALEILMLDLTMTALVPLLISAVTAAVIDYFFMGKHAAFAFEIVNPFVLKEIPWFIMLGIFTGLVSLYFTRVNMKVEAWFAGIEKGYRKFLIGGVALGILVFLFPPLWGEGYDSLKTILDGRGTELTNNSLFYYIRDKYWFFLGFLALIMVFKVVAMAVTTGSGGIGGVFAPSLFMGGVSGYFFGLLINKFEFINVSERNFALIGMAGIMAGVMHAPLTAIFLIAEITGGYSLFIPLIITATISYLVIEIFEPHSIYTMRLAQRGELVTHDKDKSALAMLSIEKLIETNFHTININANLGDLIKVIEQSHRNVFPVIDDNNVFHGVVWLDDIRGIIFKPELYETTPVKSFLYMPDVQVDINETVENIAEKFQHCGHYNLPVLDGDKYLGFVSRANVFSSYRQIIHEFSEE